MNINIFNDSVNTDRFSMKPAFESFAGNQAYTNFHELLNGYFIPAISKHIIQSLIRFAFYIEPVKQPKIESTKFSVRWADTLNNDPRQCSFNDCKNIFDKLVADLTEQLNNEDNQNLIKTIATHTLIAYELNIDYVNRIQNGQIHTVDNVSFFWGNAPKQTYSLRQYLLNPNNHNYTNFFAETYSKIAVKSFLTDRVLTGEHKTNREKRWECHPNSVHFALKKECLEIEAKLIKQICHFEGFPNELRTLISDNQVIVLSNETTKCPVTLDPIQFERFQNEILNPIHGKSSFQVGHMHPLKSVGENKFTGHTAENISWISSEGNRIQGELSIEETRELILRIIANYRQAGLVD